MVPIRLVFLKNLSIVRPMADNHSYQWLPDPKTIVYKPTISHIPTSNKHNTTKKERFCEDQKYT